MGHPTPVYPEDTSELPPGYYSIPQAYSEVYDIHIGHKHHLCSLVEEGIATLDQVKAMVKNPKFICKKCGRVAAKEENLCEPVSL